MNAQRNAKKRFYSLVLLMLGAWWVANPAWGQNNVLYHGGSGMGHSQSDSLLLVLGTGLPPLPPPPLMYLGGTGKGDYWALRQGTLLGSGPSPSAFESLPPYRGLAGKGDAVLLFKGRILGKGISPLFNNLVLYHGKMGKGDNSLREDGNILGEGLLPLFNNLAMYQGHQGRGDHFAVQWNAAPLYNDLAMYSGSAGRGDDVFRLRENPLLSLDFIYAGGTGKGDITGQNRYNAFVHSGRLLEAANWRTGLVPDSSDRALIMAHARVDVPATFRDVWVLNDGVVSIEPQAVLRIRQSVRNTTGRLRSLRVRADSLTGYSGNYIGPSYAMAELQLGLNEDGWHNSSFGIQPGPKLDSLQALNTSIQLNLSQNPSRQNIVYYNTNRSGGQQIGFQIGTYSSHAWGSWLYPDSLRDLHGTGYNLFIDDFFGGTPNTLKVWGTTFDQSLSLDLYPDFGGWNLLPNPYPSALDLNTFYQRNNSAIGVGIHVWNPGQDNYAAIDAATGLSVNGQLNNLTGQVAMGQAFYVRPLNYVNNTAAMGTLGNGSVSTAVLEPQMRSASQVRHLKKDYDRILISLIDQASTINDQYLLVLDHSFDKSFDIAEDVQKLLPNTGKAQLFEALENEALAISKKDYPTDSDTVNIGLVNYPTPRQLQLRLDRQPPGMSLYVRDVASGAIEAFRPGETYHLRTKAPEGAIAWYQIFYAHSDPGLEARMLRQPYTYDHEALGMVVVANQWEGTTHSTVQISDATGKILWQQDFQSLPSKIIPGISKPAVYLIQIVDHNTGRRWRHKTAL